MSDCNFSIAFTGTPKELIAKAKSAITGAGGNFSGDETKGDIEISTPIGKIKGNYAINNSAIDITITDKPLFVSCKRIEDELKKQLSN